MVVSVWAPPKCMILSVAGSGALSAGSSVTLIRRWWCPENSVLSPAFATVMLRMPNLMVSGDDTSALFWGSRMKTSASLAASEISAAKGFFSLV